MWGGGRALFFGGEGKDGVAGEAGVEDDAGGGSGGGQTAVSVVVVVVVVEWDDLDVEVVSVRGLVGDAVDVVEERMGGVGVGGDEGVGDVGTLAAREVSSVGRGEGGEVGDGLFLLGELERRPTEAERGEERGDIGRLEVGASRVDVSDGGEEAAFCGFVGGVGDGGGDGRDLARLEGVGEGERGGRRRRR